MAFVTGVLLLGTMPSDVQALYFGRSGEVVGGVVRGTPPRNASTNLIWIDVDDCILEDAVMMAAKCGEVTIITHPPDVQSRISMHVTDVVWQVALSNVLAGQHLILVERPPSSEVFYVTHDLNYPIQHVVLPEFMPAPAPVFDYPPSEWCSDAMQGIVNAGFIDNTLGNGIFAFLLCLILLVVVVRLLVSEVVRDVWQQRIWRPAEPAGRLWATVVAGWCAALMLSLLYGLIVGSWAFLPMACQLLGQGWGSAVRSTQAVTVSSSLAIGGLLLTLLFFGVCVGTMHLIRLAARPPRRGMLAVLLALGALPLVFFMRDSPPLRDGVTWDSLPVPAEHSAESYACLQQLIGPNALRLPDDCSLGDVQTNVLAHADDIQRAWEAVRPAWSIVEQLDTFESIADLTPPPHPPDFEPYSRTLFTSCRRLVWISSSYALLRNAQGRPKEAARVLSTLHSVIGKALPYARDVILKMILVAMDGLTISTAHDVVTSPTCDAEAMRMLQDAFPPLSREEASLRVMLTARRLIARAAFEQYVPRVGVGMALKEASVRLPVDGVDPLPAEEAWERGLSVILAPLIYHPNRAARDACALYDAWIAGAEKQPPDLSLADAGVREYEERRPIRNFGGWWLVNSSEAVCWTKAVNTASRIKVRSDLLAMELHKLNGQELELPDYFTGKRFLVDEKTGELYSPGPDKTPGTDDDVRLSKAW